MPRWPVIGVGIWLIWAGITYFLIGWSMETFVYGGLTILAVAYPIFCVREILRADAKKGFVAQPIPDDVDNCRKWMADIEHDAQQFGFHRCDEMLLKWTSREQIIYVLENPSTHTNLLITDIRGALPPGRRSLILMSMLNHGFTLETVNAVLGTKKRRPVNELIQVFPGSNLAQMLQRHTEATAFLASKGLNPVSFPGKTVRDELAADWSKQSYGFRSVISRILAELRPGTPYDLPIEDQVRDGLISLPSNVY